MSVLSKIPRTNIKLADILDTVGVSGSIPLFQTSANLNPFARWKPVPYNVDFCQDHSPSGMDYLSGWWRGYISGDTYNSGRCGVYFPTYTKASSMKGVTDSLWRHNPPTGSPSQPFRLGDFAGYNPSAKSIISSTSVNPTGDVFISTTGHRSNAMVIFNDNLSTDALDYTEIGYRSSNQQWLNDFYFGVIVIKTSGTTYGVVSLPYTMRELNNQTADEYHSQDDHRAFVQINGALFNTVGEYDLYPVLFLNKQTMQGGTMDISCGTYIPLPVKPTRVNVISPSSLYNAEITSVTLSGNTLTVKYTVSAVSGSSLTFGPTNNTPTLEVRAYTDIAEGKEIFPYSGNTFAQYVGNYTVPSGGSVNCSDVVNVLSASGYKYISVSIRWPQNFGASKMDIAI